MVSVGNSQPPGSSGLCLGKSFLGFSPPHIQQAEEKRHWLPVPFALQCRSLQIYGWMCCIQCRLESKHLFELAGPKGSGRIITSADVFSLDPDAWHSALAGDLQEGRLDGIPVVFLVELDNRGRHLQFIGKYSLAGNEQEHQSDCHGDVFKRDIRRDDVAKRKRT